MKRDFLGDYRQYSSSHVYSNTIAHLFFLLRNTLEYIRYFGISNIDIFTHCENSTGVGNVFSIDFECKIHHLSYIVNIKKKDDIIFCMIDDLLK